MRRTDREITDLQDILAILGKCDTVRLGLCTSDYPYVVPLSFGYESDGSVVTLWFHCAHEGAKLDYIKQDHHAGFEADCSHRLVPADKACGFSMEFESVMGYGDISVCDDTTSKLRGLRAVMGHYAPDKDFDFSDAELASVTVLRLDVAHISGKRLIKNTG